MNDSFWGEWRFAFRGTENPQDMTNDAWKRCIETVRKARRENENPAENREYRALYDNDDSRGGSPRWFFDRFGRSETVLPDGRTVYIAGEHEDSYDPDFYIYNDVVVTDAAGDVLHIFGYPESVFPPTDFHTATLAGNEVFLIGNVGYQGKRQLGHTQVLQLEIDTWRISPVEASGESPGWIYQHKAELSADGREIRITGGFVDGGGFKQHFENIDDWAFELPTGCWKRLTRRRWTRFELTWSEWGSKHFSDIQKSCGEIPWIRVTKCEPLRRGRVPDTGFEKMPEMVFDPPVAAEIISKKELPSLVDWEAVERENPDIDYDTILKLWAEEERMKEKAEAEQAGIRRIRVGDVIVRYVESYEGIRVYIEGELPGDIVERIKNDIMEKLAFVKRLPIICWEILPE